MDYYNHLQRESFYKDDIGRNNFNGAEDKKMEQFTIQQIELYIQQQYQVNIPGIIFEYNSQAGAKDFAGWDHDDLVEFFSHFGEIDTLEICGRMSFVLFKSFFDANTAREFLQNSSNFKEAEKNNFTAKWFKNEDEKDFSDYFKTKISKIIQTYNENNIRNLQNFNMINQQQPNNYNFYHPNWTNQVTNQLNMMNQPNNLMMNDQISFNNSSVNLNNNLNTSNKTNKSGMNNISSNNNLQQFNGINGNMINTGMMANNNQGFSVSLANGRKNSTNSSADNDEKKNQQQQQNGKFTCRFELQIENDKEFQVARRLIGAKGCNMKKIVDTCSKNFDGSLIKDAVKLRLRGKGSGYKEGPLNKESDEPLHLCISSKFLDKYRLACNQVQELVSSVYDEYKKFCEKSNKIPVSCLAVRKEEGISSRKSTVNNKQDFDA